MTHECLWWCARGFAVIPMDEFEGRMTADAHTIMVESAVASGMNTLRVRLE